MFCVDCRSDGCLRAAIRVRHKLRLHYKRYYLGDNRLLISYDVGAGGGSLVLGRLRGSVKVMLPEIVTSNPWDEPQSKTRFNANSAIISIAAACFQA